MDPLGGAIGTDAQNALPVIDVVLPAAWYVVQTKRYREAVAQRFIEDRGLSTYLPRIVQWPRPAVGNAIQPMFPGYLFVYLAAADDFYRVMWMPGVKAFVTFGTGAAAVDQTMIDLLRSREGTDGLIHLGETIGENTEVRIVDGPFRGLSAIVEQHLPARERVRVLMHILQRQTLVELPEKWVRQA